MGRIVYTYWDCKYCGTKAITGDIRECPHCGHARDNNITFYLSPQKVTYISEEKVKKVSKNPDWLCSFCNTLNADASATCKSCGASKEASEANYFENKKKREEKRKSVTSQAPTSDNNIHPSLYQTSYHKDDNPSQKASSLTPKASSTPLWSIFLVIIACLLLGGVFYYYTHQTQDITVQSLSWEYTIQIETLKTVDECGWSLPSSARLKSTQSEIHHYDDVLDHYETRTRQVQKQRITGYEEYITGYKDLGNGYAEEMTATRPIYETYYDTETYEEPIYRKEPVYQTKYYYEIDRWVHERNIITSGNDKNPYWGEVNLSSKERVGDKSEVYSIYGTNTKGKEVHFSISYEDFNQIELSRTYSFKISFGNGKLIQK